MPSAADLEPVLSTLSGNQVADLVRRHALESGQSFRKFLAPWGTVGRLSEVSFAKRLPETTIVRLAALLSGEPIPEVRRYHRPARDSKAERPGAAAQRNPVRVYRDPCILCGVRGDIGCRHQPADPVEPPPAEARLPLAEQVKREAMIAGLRRRRAWSFQSLTVLDAEDGDDGDAA